MACAVFTIPGVYAAATNKAKVWLVGGSAFLAAIFFGLAAYYAWREEHDKYTGEVASYQRPDISGEAFNFTGYRFQGNDRTDWSASYEVKFEVLFRNCQAWQRKWFPFRRAVLWEQAGLRISTPSGRRQDTS